MWRGVYAGSGSIGGYALSSKEWASFEIEMTGDEAGLFESTNQLAFKKISLRRIQPSRFQSQLSFYLNQLCRGDLGQSSIFKQPVANY